MCQQAMWTEQWQRWSEENKRFHQRIDGYLDRLERDLPKINALQAIIQSEQQRNEVIYGSDSER